MKMNKKIIVSTLALAMGAALAGSVSGTVAWFQYSTRAQVAYIGETAHCSENLLMTKGAVSSTSVWKSEFASDTADNANKDIIPITTGKLGSAAALPVIAEGTNQGKPEFYLNPLYQIPEYSKWGVASEANYVQLELHFHVKDIDGESTVTYLEKDLYLTDLTIKAKQTDNSDSDLYKAIRVHMAATNDNTNFTYNLFARDDTANAAATISTDVYGNLDLNNDGALDLEEGYEWDFNGTNTRDVLVYGDDQQVQSAKNVAHKDSNNKVDVLADDSDPYAIVANGGKIGTIKNQEDGLKVIVTIWLEGWQKLAAETDNYDTTTSAVWKAADYIGKNFQVGMRFAVDAHEQGHN